MRGRNYDRSAGCATPHPPGSPLREWARRSDVYSGHALHPLPLEEQLAALRRLHAALQLEVLRQPAHGRRDNRLAGPRPARRHRLLEDAAPLHAVARPGRVAARAVLRAQHVLLLGEHLHLRRAARVHPPHAAVLRAHRLERLGRRVVRLHVREGAVAQRAHRLRLGQVHLGAGHRGARARRRHRHLRHGERRGGQRQGAAAHLHLHGRRGGLGEDDGPVVARERHAQLVPGGHHAGGVVELHGGVRRLPPLLGGEVHHAVREAGGLAVGRHRAQARHQVARHLLASLRRELHLQGGGAQHERVLRQGGAVEARRAGVLLLLVPGHLRLVAAHRPPGAARLAGGARLGVALGQGLRGRRRRVNQGHVARGARGGASGGEPGQLHALGGAHLLRVHGVLEGQPHAGGGLAALLLLGGDHLGGVDEELQRALLHRRLLDEAVRHPLRDLLQEGVLGPHRGQVGELMRPGAHHGADGSHAHLVGGGREAGHRVEVAAGGGAAEGEHGDAGGAAGHLLEGAVVPVGGLRLGAGEPARHGGLQRLEALQPRPAPRARRLEGRGLGARGVGGLRDGVQHPGAPREVGRQEGAALVVHVVLEAALRGAHGDDAREVGGGGRRRLQRGDAAPRDAHEHHLAVAPGLRRGPLHRRAEVVQARLAVLVVQGALRVARAAVVQAHAGEALPGQVGVGGAVHLHGAVRLAVGDHVHQARHLDGGAGAALGDPGAPRQADGLAAVLSHGHRHLRHALDGVGELRLGHHLEHGGVGGELHGAAGDGRGRLLGVALVDEGGELAERRHVDELREGDGAGQRLADLAEHLHGQEGVPAQLEEIVRGGDVRHAQQLAPDLGERRLGGALGGHQVLQPADGRRHVLQGGAGERLAVHLAVVGLGDLLQADEGGGHHVLGEGLAEVVADHRHLAHRQRGAVARPEADLQARRQLALVGVQLVVLLELALGQHDGAAVVRAEVLAGALERDRLDEGAGLHLLVVHEQHVHLHRLLDVPEDLGAVPERLTQAVDLLGLHGGHLRRARHHLLQQVLGVGAVAGAVAHLLDHALAHRQAAVHHARDGEHGGAGLGEHLAQALGGVLLGGVRLHLVGHEDGGLGGAGVALRLVEGDVVAEHGELRVVLAALDVELHRRQAGDAPGEQHEQLGVDEQLLLVAHALVDAHAELLHGELLLRLVQLRRAVEVVDHLVAAHVAQEERPAGLHRGERLLHALQEVRRRGEVHGHAVAHDGVQALLHEAHRLVGAAERRLHDVVLLEGAELGALHDVLDVVHRRLGQVRGDVALAVLGAAQQNHAVAAAQLQAAARLQAQHAVARPLHPLLHHVQLVRDAGGERVVVAREVQRRVVVHRVLGRVRRVVDGAPRGDGLQVLLGGHHLLQPARLGLGRLQLGLGLGLRGGHRLLLLGSGALRHLLRLLVHDEVGDEALLRAVALGVDLGVHHRLHHALRARHLRLDLRQLDAEPADLHLVVHAAHALEHVRGGVPLGHVACVVHLRARLLKGARHEALHREVVAPEVPRGQAQPPDPELSGHARGEQVAELVQHVDRCVGNGLADGHVLAERLAAAGEAGAGGPHGGLGGAVDVPQLAHLGGELVLERRGEGLAAAERAQLGVAAPVRAHQHAPGGGGRLQDGGAVLGDQVAQLVGAPGLVALRQHHLGAAHQGEVQLQPGDVEAHGGHRHKRVRGAGAQHALEAEEEVDHGLVADLHALGAAGGAGGEDDVHELRGGGVHSHVGVGTTGGGDGRRVTVQADEFGGGHGGQAEGGGDVLGGHHHRRLGVLQHHRDAVLGVEGVQGDIAGARLLHGEERRHELGRALKEDTHEVALLHAARLQVVRELVRLGVQLLVGDALRQLRELQRHRLRVRRCLLLKQLVHATRGQLHLCGVVGLQQLLLLSGLHIGDAGNGGGAALGEQLQQAHKVAGHLLRLAVEEVTILVV
mmetsp:Transcript_9416/g.19474  ORF Transcript_9416/g.19474 Transcript_9416/m.19474 type:complete len:1935 (-) Transcript_9416:657-6461(-)